MGRSKAGWDMIYRSWKNYPMNQEKPMPTICFYCQKELALEGKVSRKDQCLYCGTDLHCCRNCEFYDEYAHNKCREPQAEYVSDREKGNFCEYFCFARSEMTGAQGDAKERAKAEWETLFRKK
jgi:hypothetical protein